MKSNLVDRITIESGKCGGRPCIRGMRIRVTDILGLLGSGASHQEILQDYPMLEEQDIHASLEFVGCSSLRITASSTLTDELAFRLRAVAH